MAKKQQARLKRAKKTRMHIKRLDTVRLSVHRTASHIYAQVIEPVNGTVVASASTLEKAFRGKKSVGNKTEAAKLVGKTVAERAVKAGVKKIAFDRSGFKYHGRVKALAEGAREGGLEEL